MPWISFPFLLLTKPWEKFTETERERETLLAQKTVLQLIWRSRRCQHDWKRGSIQGAFLQRDHPGRTFVQDAAKHVALDMYLIFQSLWQPALGTLGGTRKRTNACAHSHRCHLCPARVPCLDLCWYWTWTCSSGMRDTAFSTPAATHCVGSNSAVTPGRRENRAILPPFCLLVGQGFLFFFRTGTQEYSS